MDRGSDVLVRRTAVLCVAVTVLVGGAGIASAQSFQGAAGTVIVEEGETYDRVEGIAGTIVVRGTVEGDVTGAAGTVHVAESGRILGGIDAAAGSVRIDGAVAGDVRVAAGSVEITDSARIGGALDSGAGSISIDGTIDGTVHAGAESLVIGPNAVIGDDLRYDADEITRDEGATIGGEVVRDPDIGGGFDPLVDGSIAPTWLWMAYGFLANLLLGAVLLAAFPAFSARVASNVAGDPLRSGGVGLMTTIGVPIGLVLVAITIVGIPLAFLGAFGFALTAWIAIVYGQFAIAMWTLGRLGVENRWLALVAGLLGFVVVGAIPIVGGLAELAAFLLGLGALTLAVLDVYRRRRNDPSGGRQTTLGEVAGDGSVAE